MNNTLYENEISRKHKTEPNLYEALRKNRLFYLRIIFLRISRTGLIGFVKDTANFFLALMSVLGFKFVSKPLYAQIEPTSRCNLRCRMCISNTPGYERNDLSFIEFRQIIDKLSSVICLNIQGNGEPLLNDNIFRMINYAVQSGKAVFTCTNAMLLDDDKIQKILKTGLFELGISMESTDKEKYEYIRRGSDFDKLVQNISRLVELRDEINPKLIVKLWVTIMNHNIEEIRDIIRFASDLGLDGIYFQQIQNKYDYRANYSGNFYSDPESGLFFNRKSFIREFEQFARELNVPINFTQRCFWPWMGFFINSKGFATPCCVINDYKKYSTGNIFSDDLKKVWNHPSYRGLRVPVSVRRKLSCCEGCSFE